MQLLSNGFFNVRSGMVFILVHGMH